MTEAASATPTPPVFNIEKLYVKDLSVEVPHAPSIFLERDPPQIDINLNSEYSAIDQGVYEVVVLVTLTAKLPNQDKVVFLIEAKQAGIFRLQNFPAAEIEPTLEVVCTNIIYPYLREVVTEASVRAGFMPVIMTPVNFDALYQQRKAQESTKH
jgi:preprotein translocase subunit SecB